MIPGYKLPPDRKDSTHAMEEKLRQAGAELGQAQVKLEVIV